MRIFPAIMFILLLAACSKHSDINPESLKGSYKGQQQFITINYVLIYPIDLEISLNGTSWEAKAKNSSGATFLLSGGYTIEKDSAKFTNHGMAQDAPHLLSTNYKITVRGDSLYLKRVINGNGEVYSLKRN